MLIFHDNSCLSLRLPPLFSQLSETTVAPRTEGLKSRLGGVSVLTAMAAYLT